MCFSATASFVTGVLLIPVGLRSVSLALRQDPSRWLPLAVTPLLFAGQQALEGIVWLVLDQALPGSLLRPAALAYLGFAFALWPVWMPWCSLRLAAGRTGVGRQWLMRLCGAMGCLLAARLWIPLLLAPGLIDPIVRHGSIDYQASLSGPALLGHQPGSLLYALIVCLPLLLTSSRRLRWLAVALALAFVVVQVAYLHAFSSVWCYFSAILSVLVVWVLREEEELQGHGRRPAEP